LLNYCCRSRHQAHIETSDPDALFDIDRKQNIRSSLTYISDNTYDFFSKLSSEILELETVNTLNEAGESMHEYIASFLDEKEDLKNVWLGLFPCELVLGKQNIRGDDIRELVSELYTEVVNIFSKVMLNKFRKDLLQSMRTSKSKSLRI
jgi:hypothetical protein